MINALQMASILMEMVVAFLAVMLAVSKKKQYGWFIAFTYLIYVFYDLVHLLKLDISSDLLYFVFFAATVSILWAIWNIILEA
jgi:hypothetical protein